MNDIYARRMGQTAMFQNLYRTHGTLWQATRVTKEKLDARFVQEDFMRANGYRAMPLLVPAASRDKMQFAHYNQLQDTCAWAESGRAFGVRFQTPLTKHACEMGRMADTIPSVRSHTTGQSMFAAVNNKIDGITTHEEEPHTDDWEP